jgi:hypothetical protein
MIRSMMRRLSGDRWPSVKPGEQLTCPEVGRLLQRFLDDELADPVAVDALADHLDACGGCGLEAETYRRIKAALAERRVDLPVESLERLRSFGERLAEG